MSQRKRIAIIGAGPSGLAAIKACKEEELDVVCFERNGDPGGLWRYHDEDIEGLASVMKTTIINSSKEMCAFSDFPAPKEYPNNMHHTMMYKYLMLYAEKFDLLKHIRYYREVISVEPSDSFEETGRWLVTTKDTKTNVLAEEEFCGVMVCIGHHVYPKVPSFPGQEKFEGTITHTHSIKKCDAYSGKKVVVVGIGNSGVDVSVECTVVAENVYLSTRRGSWIFPRVGKYGRPSDLNIANRRNLFFAKFMSYDSICDKLENELNMRLNHTAYNLKPKHRALSAHPTVNDCLPNAILSGRVVVKGNIMRFERKGVLFEGDEEITEVDAVILATGYHIKFPFLAENLICSKDNIVQLYKYSIPPQLKHHTLAIIGLVQPLGGIFPVSEMSSRWFVQIFTGKLKLPPLAEMEKEIEAKNCANAKRYVASTRHTIQVDFLPFMDELAEQIGAKPNLLKLAVTDPKLFWACFNDPVFAYQYRIQGPHLWSGARDTILNFEERVSCPLNTRWKTVANEERNSLLHRVSIFAIYGAVAAALCWRLGLGKSGTE